MSLINRLKMLLQNPQFNIFYGMMSWFKDYMQAILFTFSPQRKQLQTPNFDKQQSSVKLIHILKQYTKYLRP